MKRNTFIRLLLAVVFLYATGGISSTVAAGRKFVVELNVLNFDGGKYGIKPGDTISIKPGKRDRLRFANIHGDSLNYVTFINGNGISEINTTSYSPGLLVYDCSYFRLTGTGSNSYNYGIRIGKTSGGNSGLSVDGASTNYEVDHLEVVNSGFAGICANPKPDCDDRLNRGHFTRRNTSFHDNYVHSVGGEGFYIGHSFYTGYTITCDSVQKTVYPHEIKGLKIYNNLVDSAGYDGIQVGCAIEGCEIYANRITNYGASNTKDQNFGIVIAAGTGGTCNNNLIMNGTGNGINVFGTGGNVIYNNLIINPGKPANSNMTTSKAIGIFCDDRYTIPGSSFKLLNNTIISSKGDGIRFYSKISRNNLICNNIILNPGTYGTYPSYVSPTSCYVYIVDGVDAVISNNYYSGSLVANSQFNTPDDVYNYCKNLPVFSKGISVQEYGIFTDFYQNNRPLTSSDIGAFEYPDSIKISLPQKSIKVIQSGNGEISVYSEQKEVIRNISVYRISGQLIQSLEPNSANITFNTNRNVSNGVYIVSITTANGDSRNKIVIN